MNYNFEYLNKAEVANALPHLFEILYTNMKTIVQSESYDKAYQRWHSSVLPAMKKDARQIVLMYSDNTLAGYFQYYISSETLMMEEIQIRKEYQGTGLFNSFYSWLVYKLPQNIEHVEAYSDKKNYRSQNILEHLGLVKYGETPDSDFYHYKGKYVNIKNRYQLNCPDFT